MIDISILTGKNEVSTNSMYFFSKDEFNALSLAHQDQFLILDKESTKKAYEGFAEKDVLCGDDGWGNTPFSKGCYQKVKKIKGWKDETVIKKWLYECGVPFKSKAVILPVFSGENDPAIIATWKMITKYPATFFDSDNIVVCAPSLDWCLYYHHDNIMYFASGWKYHM